MYYLGKVIASATRELFRWLLWNKTGQKVLLVVLVFLIGFFFIKLGEVAAAEPDNFSSWDEVSFDGSVSGIALSGSTGKFSESAPFVSYYFEINPFNYYAIYSWTSTSTTASSYTYGFSDSIPSVGGTAFNATYKTILGGESQDFYFDGSNGHKYFVISYVPSSAKEFKLFYNAYPYEVTPMRSSLISYAYGLFQPTYFDSSSDYRNQCTWFFPIKKGFSYRILNGGNQLNSSTKYSFSFLSSVDGFNTYFSSKSPNTYNSNYDSSIDCLQVVNYGGDFVAPDDGYLILPGYLSQDSSYKLFSSQSDTSITASNSSVNTNINQSTSAINNVNDSITDSSIPDQDSDYDLPSVSVSSDTDSSFGNLFDKIYNAFTSEDIESFSIPLPYGDPIVIDGSLVSNISIHPVDTILFAFWYYFFALIIVKDIGKKIELIRSGNVENIENSNIKEDIL